MLKNYREIGGATLRRDKQKMNMHTIKWKRKITSIRINTKSRYKMNNMFSLIDYLAIYNFAFMLYVNSSI